MKDTNLTKHETMLELVHTERTGFPGSFLKTL